MILKISKNEKPVLYTDYANEVKFFSNGTLILGPARTSYSGKYSLERDGNNATIQKEDMQVKIQGR